MSELDYLDSASDDEITDEEPDAVMVLTNDDDEVDDDEDTASDEEITDDDEVELSEAEKEAESLRKQLNDTKAAFAESQAARHKLEGALEVTQKADQGDVKDLFDSIDKDAVVEDPSLLIDALKEFRNEVVGTFANNNAWIEAQVRKAQADPTLQEAIEELRKDPDYATLNDATLEIIAKKQPRAAKKTLKAPRGSVGNGSTPVTESKVEDVRDGKMYALLHPDLYAERQAAKKASK